MKFKFIFKLLSAGTAFFSWYKKASEDGKIDFQEAKILLEELAEIFDIKLELKIPEY